MAIEQPVTQSARAKLVLKYTLLRKNFLKSILGRARVQQVRGHWIYTHDLAPQSVVIDLGANQGLFSKEVYDAWQCKCYAIEPNPELFRGIDDAHISKLNYAVTAEDGQLDFYISNNNEASSIIKDFEQLWGNQKKISIEGLSLKTLEGRLNLTGKTIEILKIDIEGAELELIESMTPEDVRHIRQITIEFHDWINAGLHDRTVNAIKKLVALGFDTYTDTPNHKWPVEMLFLNRNLVKLSRAQKFYLSVFNRFAFLRY